MRTKLVLWGTNDKDEKLLIGVELQQENNNVNIYTFPEKSATEDFYNRMMNLWRNDQPMSFPEDHATITRPLTLTDDLLPETIKADRTDIIIRAKAEWHFVVLSAKLYESYRAEIEDYREKIQELNEFKPDVWESLKTFWSKVQTHIYEKSLFKDHADELKIEVNTLFGQLKDLKKIENAKFAEISSGVAKGFYDKIADITDRVEKGLGLQPIFNELKKLQGEFRNTNFTRTDQNKVWKKLDGAFKLVKQKKFGSGANDFSAVERIRRRFNGLISAIEKMEKSIKRDKDEIEFQNRKISSTNGQLEMQIRQAKLAMIQERIKSKDEKLKEMLKTKGQLEQKMNNEQKKADAKSTKEAQKVEQAKATPPPVATEAKATDKATEAKTESKDAPTQAKPEAAEKPIEVKTESKGAPTEAKPKVAEKPAEVKSEKAPESPVVAKANVISEVTAPTPKVTGASEEE